MKYGYIHLHQSFHCSTTLRWRMPDSCLLLMLLKNGKREKATSIIILFSLFLFYTYNLKATLDFSPLDYKEMINCSYLIFQKEILSIATSALTTGVLLLVSFLYQLLWLFYFNYFEIDKKWDTLEECLDTISKKLVFAPFDEDDWEDFDGAFGSDNEDDLFDDDNSNSLFIYYLFNSFPSFLLFSYNKC